MPRQKILKSFARVEILKTLSPESQQILAEFSAFRPIHQHETLFCKGEPSPYCFAVLSGEVRVGSQICGEGRVIGVGSLFNEETHADLACVHRDGEVLAIWSSRFRTWSDNRAGKERVLNELKAALEDVSDNA